ncbi:MAG TPA: sugar phosphate nucleotidyltransferase [Sphingomicrobium sp.]|nr:sugar phosphate nucleotidyltransferase [Sphingomicrobium sp.]
MLSTNTPVIILCGGEGSRIADVSRDAVPKPLLPIGDKPILWHIMKIYEAHGFSNFILALGHLGWEIKDYFLNERLMDCDFRLEVEGDERRVEVLGNASRTRRSIIFAETGEKTQTGERIARCRQYVTTDYFMATYGDGVGDIDIGALGRFAVDQGKIGTVTSVTPAGRFGNIEVDDGTVTAFAEKPDAGGGSINGGFFVFKREFFDVVDKYGDVMLERQPMDDLVARGELAAYRHAGFWEPMDTMREYRLLNRLWENGEARWKVW